MNTVLAAFAPCKVQDLTDDTREHRQGLPTLVHVDVAILMYYISHPPVIIKYRTWYRTYAHTAVYFAVAHLVCFRWRFGFAVVTYVDGS